MTRIAWSYKKNGKNKDTEKGIRITFDMKDVYDPKKDGSTKYWKTSSK
jgi:hypothetical protein